MIRCLPLLALLLAAAPAPRSIDGLPIGELPRQALPARGCAAYLFTVGQTRVLAAKLSADPAALRLAMGGQIVDLARSDGGATGAYGLPGTATYAGALGRASINLTVAQRRDLAQGASATATLTLDRQGQDAIVIPLAGLVGCA